MQASGTCLCHPHLLQGREQLQCSFAAHPPGGDHAQALALQLWSTWRLCSGSHLLANTTQASPGLNCLEMKFLGACSAFCQCQIISKVACPYLLPPVILKFLLLHVLYFAGIGLLMFANAVRTEQHRPVVLVPSACATDRASSPLWAAAARTRGAQHGEMDTRNNSWLLIFLPDFKKHRTTCFIAFSGLN